MPITAGVLFHLIRKTPTGSRMRSRFRIGRNNIKPRGLIGYPAAALAKVGLKPTGTDARALLVHCAQETTHLASFLPALYAQCKDLDKTSRDRGRPRPLFLQRSSAGEDARAPNDPKHIDIMSAIFQCD